jgi:transposase
MKNGSYSELFKQRAVQQSLLPGSPGLNATANKIGIPTSTLFDWKKKYANNVSMKKTKSVAGSWTPEKKLQVIIETSSLSENELGEYLRKHGLHSSDIKEWKEECLSGFKSRGRPKKDPEFFELRKEKKDLERDLRRKEKALAEMSARVILLKKSQEIFGEIEEDE